MSVSFQKIQNHHSSSSASFCLYEDAQTHMPVIYSPQHWILRFWNKVRGRTPEQAPSNNPHQFASRVCRLVSDRLDAIKNNKDELSSARTLLEISYKALRQQRAVEIRAHNHHNACSVRAQQILVSIKLREVIKELAKLTKSSSLSLLISGEDESKREAVRMVKNGASLQDESSSTCAKIAQYVCSYKKSEYEWSRILFSPLSGYSSKSSQHVGYLPSSAVPQDIVAKIFTAKLEKENVDAAKFLRERKFINESTLQSVFDKYPNLRSLLSEGSSKVETT